MVGRTVVFLTALHLISSHPAKDIRLPRVNISNPYEINNLNYYNSNEDPEPEASHHFKRTVSDFQRSVNYIDKTVKEVESLLNSNSSLPRLTRGEILEIIENITKADAEAKVSTPQKDKTALVLSNAGPKRDQKAVMLVMPYTADNGDDGKMQELFTKPPVTRIVGDGNKTELKLENKRRRRPFPVIPQGGVLVGEVFPEPLADRTTRAPDPPLKKSNYRSKPIAAASTLDIQTQKPLVTTEKAKSTTSQLPTTKQPLTTKPFTTKAPITKQPQSFTRRPYASTRSPQTSTTSFPSTTHKPHYESPTNRPKRRRGSTTARSTTTSTEISVVGEDTTKATRFPHRKRRPSKKPQRYSNHKYPDETEPAVVHEGLKVIDSPKVINVSTFETVKIERPLTTAAPVMSSKPHPFTTSNPALPSLPEDLKDTLDDLKLADSLAKATEEVYAKPPPLNENVKNLLASIGVLPSSTTTTTTPVPDISPVADTLSSDMRDLLKSFGLLPDPNYKAPNLKDLTISMPTAEVDPSSYVQFKPLPDYSRTPEDMQEFLGRFGLGKNSKINRNQKSLESKPVTFADVPQLDAGMVPESMKQLLSDLGLVGREGKKIRGQPFQKTAEKTNVIPKVTTKPATTTPATFANAQQELEKLHQLLDIIKQLEKLNGSATDQELNKLDLRKVNDLVGSFNKDMNTPLDEQEWAPDPLKFDEGLSKNEVKRQENSSSTTEVILTVIPETTSTTEEPKTPDIKDLEDSFGGSSDSGPTATLPPATEAPNTGFYYLLDWNSFLDIDDQKGKRVNLRFQPKVGDPKRFYSVSVP